MNNITKEFKLFIDIVKNLKSDYIYILNDRVYSVIQNTIIKSSTNNLYGYLNGIYEIDLLSLINIFDIHKESNKDIFIYGNIIYCNDIQIMFKPSQFINTSLSLILKTSPIYSNNDLREDDIFNSIISGKVADGASLFIIDNKYPMTIYGSLLNVNKSDTVELKIYNIDNISFLSVFTVNKKKFEIDTYVRFMYL